MEDIQINVYAFLGVMELTLLLLVSTLVLVIRTKKLAHWQALARKKLKELKQLPATVSFEQYLREALNLNQGLIESAVASHDEADKNTVELMEIRAKFLELELDAQASVDDPNAFRERLIAGLSELIEGLGPEVQTTADSGEETFEILPQQDDAAEEQEHSGQRRQIDTHDAEFDRLKEVINNQQDDRHEMERKIQDLEALLEFKDATIEELEKQNKKLEVSLLAVSGEK